MNKQQAGVTTAALGLLLLVFPLYEYILIDVGVVGVLDPISALGFASGYPVAVGGAALSVGMSIIFFTNENHRLAVRLLAAGIIGSCIGVVSIVGLTSTPIDWAILVGLAGAAPGFATARSAAQKDIQRRLGTGLLLFALVPIGTYTLIFGVSRGGLPGMASFFLILVLAVYTIMLSYPFAQLGQLVNADNTTVISSE